MDSLQKTVLIALICISGIAVLVGILQFLQVGKPLNSLYKDESRDPEPYFKMSGVIFSFIAGINFLNVLTVWLENSWLTLLVCPLVSVMMIYAYVTARKLG